MFPLTGCEEILEKYLKQWKKMVSTRKKKLVPTCKIKSVFKKRFLLISVTVLVEKRTLKQNRQFSIKRKSFSNSWNEGFVKKNKFSPDGKKAYGLYLPENPFRLPGMKHSLENTFPLYRKIVSSGKKYRKWFPRAGKYFSAKIDSP